MKNFIYIILMGCICTSCSFSLPDPDYHLKLKNWKMEIDKDVASGKIISHSIAALNKEQDIDRYYQLYQNGENNLIMASETKICNNNPSDTILTYYFDKYENIFALQVKIATDKDSLFNSATAFYNKDMKIISKEYAIIDNCNTSLEDTGDSLFVDFAQFSIPSDARGFVKDKNVFIPNRW